MRILKLNLLAVALLLLGASSASAFSFDISARTPTSGLQAGDTVTVDVFLNADQVGINFFSLAVLASDSSVLSYNGPASAALPVIYPAPAASYGTTGASPGYILYTPAVAGMTGHPATFLYPANTPFWLTWPAPPLGTQQVNVNMLEVNITDTFHTMTTGSNIWIASLVFDVTQDFTEANVSLSLTSGGNVFQIGSGPLDPNLIGLGGPVTLTGAVPEPTTAMLIGLGLIGLAVSGRRS